MTQASARTGRLEPGSVFAERFRVLHLLREGGMGAVYVVEELASGTRRALKVMLPEVLGNERLRGRFAQEANIGTQIASPHLVQVVGAGVEASTNMPWLAMELLEGSDLLARVHEKGPVEAGELAALLEQACDAIAAAHRASVVHRDLKPDNIFVCENADGSRVAKVLDFGIAKVIQEARTANSQAIGSPRWMAPEQAQEHSLIAPATDVWPLGLVAFYALTGRFYWVGSNGPKETLAKLMREMLFDPLVPASQRASELGVAHKLPPRFDEWFARCVAREPRDRYADAAVAAREMRATWAPGASRFAEVSASAGAPAAPAAAETPAATAVSGVVPVAPERAYAATQVDSEQISAAVHQSAAVASLRGGAAVVTGSAPVPAADDEPVVLPTGSKVLPIALLVTSLLVVAVAGALLLRG